VLLCAVTTAAIIAATLVALVAAPAVASPTTADAVSAGDAHTCARTSSGGAVCWGSNGSGQLGDGTKQSRPAPVAVSSLSSGVSAVAAGGSHTCALTVAGGVKCWGDNASGQLGDGTKKMRKAPVNVSGLGGGITAITAGDAHTCALTVAGGVKCWGANTSGQIGDGTTSQRKTPVDVSGLTSGVEAISAGGSHTCAVTTAGGVKCWGANTSGQIGDGTTKLRKTPVSVSGLAHGAADVAAGGAHTCALTSTGGVKCWGANTRGQLGVGTVIRHLTPVKVKGLAGGATQLAAANADTCAVASASVLCWGENADGQIGDGSITLRKKPTPVAHLTGAAGAAVGGAHTCALLSAGGIKCWGSNADGQLGDGTGADHRFATDVFGLTGGVTFIAGGTSFTCGLTSGGGAKCWGDNSSAQLGDGTLMNRTSPTDPSGLLSGLTGLAPGAGFGCAVVAGGGVRCWGNNAFGQLGDGTQSGHKTPMAVPGLASGVDAIVAGSYHACVLNVGGGVQCWGRNDHAEIGAGFAGPDPVTTPTEVSGLQSGVGQIAAGAFHACALLDTGGLQCWGRGNNGQIGDGTSVRRLAPVDVSGLTSDVASVAAGGDHTCAVKTDGSAWCWGANANGQIGDGTDDNAPGPVAVSGLPSLTTAFALGADHTCALEDDGSVWCWGRNDRGQLGDGTTDESSTPVEVSGLPAGVVGVAAGGLHSCAIDGDGGVWCWGANEHGQLGDGSTDDSPTPVQVPGIA
jgi:alpha-tubulin suppressor-like RCC1 family protein